MLMSRKSAFVTRLRGVPNDFGHPTKPVKVGSWRNCRDPAGVGGGADFPHKIQGFLRFCSPKSVGGADLAEEAAALAVGKEKTRLEQIRFGVIPPRLKDLIASESQLMDPAAGEPSGVFTEGDR